MSTTAKSIKNIARIYSLQEKKDGKTENIKVQYGFEFSPLVTAAVDFTNVLLIKFWVWH